MPPAGFQGLAPGRLRLVLHPPPPATERPSRSRPPAVAPMPSPPNVARSTGLDAISPRYQRGTAHTGGRVRYRWGELQSTGGIRLVAPPPNLDPSRPDYF